MARGPAGRHRGRPGDERYARAVQWAQMYVLSRQNFRTPGWMAEPGPRRRGRPRASLRHFGISDMFSLLTGPMWNERTMFAVRVISDATGLTQDAVFKAIRKK